MASRKPSVKKGGLLPKLKQFLESLGDRYHRVLQVIDEALVSENLKDRIWAVDWILKRTPADDPEAKVAASTPKAAPVPSMAELDALSDAELMGRIRGYLKELEP